MNSAGHANIDIESVEHSKERHEDNTKENNGSEAWNMTLGLLRTQRYTKTQRHMKDIIDTVFRCIL